MANINQFEVGSSVQASAVLPVQAPVVDNSAGITEGAIAQGLGAVGNVVSAFGNIISKNRAGEAAAANTALGNEYISALDSASGSIDQEGGSRSKALNFLGKVENELTSRGFSREAMLDLKNKYGKTFAGERLELGTVQDQAAEERENQAIKDGVIYPHMTDVQVEVAMAENDKFKQQVQANATAMRQLQLRKASGEAVDADIKRQAFKGTGEAVASYRPQVKATIEDVITRVGKGEFSSEDGVKFLQANLGDLNANLANIGRGGDLAQIKFMSEPLRELYSRSITALKEEPATALSVLENANSLIKAKNENMLLTEPKLAEAAATSTLFGHSPVVAALVSNTVASHINKNSTDDNPPANLTGSKEEQKEIGDYLKGLTEGIGVQGQVSFDGSDMVDPEELFTNVEQTLNGANRYIRPEDPASENKALVEWVANPEVGTYLKTNMGKLDSGARTKLADTLLTAGEQQVFPEVKGLLKGQFTSKPIAPRGRTGGSRNVNINEVDLVVVGNQVVFKSNTANGRLLAQGLSKKSSKALTTYLRAVSNVSGTDLATVLEENMSSIWPEKVAVEQVEEPNQEIAGEESPTDSQDFSVLPEGTVIIDEEDNRFSVNADGSLTQIRSVTNAASR